MVNLTRFAHCPGCRAELTATYGMRGGRLDLLSVAETARTVIDADVTGVPLDRLAHTLDALEHAR